MKKKIERKTILGAIVLILCTILLVVFGYRVAIKSFEVPGRLSSVSISASSLNYYGYTMRGAHKTEYKIMKYGYMDQLLLAQMDHMDQVYNDERMQEIRAVNDLTAMSQLTADRLAYEKAKQEQEEAAKKAAEAVRLAEAERKAKVKQILAMREMEKTQQNTQNQRIDTGDSSDTGSGNTASNGGQKGEPVYATTHGESLGEYVITAYCTCKICCGVYSGGNRTASGTVPTTNRTLAVDTSVIPFGTRLVINGQVYVAEDRGGAIKGKRIDMFFYTHKEALKWGRRTVEVFLAD